MTEPTEGARPDELDVEAIRKRGSRSSITRSRAASAWSSSTPRPASSQRPTSGAGDAMDDLLPRPVLRQCPPRCLPGRRRAGRPMPGTRGTPRRKVARFVGAATSEREIVFTKNATEAINLVAGSWGRANLGPRRRGRPSRELEHHANIVPWQMLGEPRRGSRSAGSRSTPDRSPGPDRPGPAPRRGQDAGRSPPCRT